MKISGTLQETRSYQTRVEIAAAPADVLEALTTLEGITGWWGRAAGSAETGGQLQVTHNHPDPLSVHVETAATSVTWFVVGYPKDPEWIGTVISFDVLPTDHDTTVVNFVHSGLTPDLDCFNHCSPGWDYFISSLRAYVETGSGTPIR